MPNYKDDGTLASQVIVKKGHRQLDVSIPVFLQEIFGIKEGDKFNWYVERKENKISLKGVYIKYESMKFIPNKIPLRRKRKGKIIVKRGIRKSPTRGKTKRYSIDYERIKK